MGHFQLISMILKFSMGHFVSLYTDFYGPFSKLMGLWRMAPCLPNHWGASSLSYYPNLNTRVTYRPVYFIFKISKGNSVKYSVRLECLLRDSYSILN